MRNAPFYTDNGAKDSLEKVAFWTVSALLPILLAFLAALLFEILHING